MLVYDIHQQKQLVPIVVVISLKEYLLKEGKPINKVAISEDSRLAFLYNGALGNPQVLVYDVQQQKQLHLSYCQRKKPLIKLFSVKIAV